MHTDLNCADAAKLRTANARWRSSLLVVVLALTGCGEGALNDATADSQPTAPTWEEFLASAYREPDTGVYVANGDETFHSLEELRAYFEAATGGDGALGKVQGTLNVSMVNGARNIWSPDQKLSLTYCVDTVSLGVNHAAAVQAMKDAADEWEGVAYVDFIHRTEFDGSCAAAQAAGNVLFAVNKVTTGGASCGQTPGGCEHDVAPPAGDASYLPAYLARAFLPNAAPSDRQMRIDLAAFDARWMTNGRSLVGILRHELGHVLGFRHEHLNRPVQLCAEELSGTENWSSEDGYNATSLMNHVACGGTAGYGYDFSGMDVQSAGIVYGRGKDDVGARAVRSKWESLGGGGGWLGASVGRLFAAANGGRGRHFQGGSVYWLSGVGAWSVRGAIRQKWADMGWEWSAAGYPTTDENDSCFGTRFNHFQNGTISWHPTDGTFFVFGGIHAKWMSLGGSCGAVGYPIGEEVGSPVYRNFNRGRIYWTSRGAVAISGVTYPQWKLRYQSMLGLPVADTQYGADGFEQSFFERGTLFYTRQWGFEYELY